mmetsp:Transcript_7644/g.22079  ORF Transcript_7644/g.22079 Transcript_7644/m.22079 type:complete len:1139 (-) Transcript_7644:33-3449(-)
MQVFGGELSDELNITAPLPPNILRSKTMPGPDRAEAGQSVSAREPRASIGIDPRLAATWGVEAGTRFEAIAELSGNEKVLQEALERTRKRLQKEIQKLEEDPLVQVNNYVNNGGAKTKRKGRKRQRKLKTKRGRRRKDNPKLSRVDSFDDDHVYEMVPAREYAAQPAPDNWDPHNLSSTLMAQTPRTRVEMLPVLANTGEAALEVGLKDFMHTLPVFKLPKVTNKATFVNRIPREESAAERKAKAREQEEVEYMKERLGLTGEELRELEEDLKQEEDIKAQPETEQGMSPKVHDEATADGYWGDEPLRSADYTRYSADSYGDEHGTLISRSGSRKRGREGMGMLSTGNSAYAFPKDLSYMDSVSMPGTPGYFLDEVSRGPPTPRVLREKNSFRVEALREELGRSITSMRHFSSAVKEDVLAVREVCPIPKNHKAHAFFRTWGAERLKAALEEVLMSIVRASLHRWKDQVGRILRAERLAKYKFYQATRKFYTFLIDMFRQKLAVGWVRWIEFYRLERAKELATVQNAAARRIQGAYRVRLARMKIKNLKLLALRQVQHDAAVLIQALARGVATRTLFAQIMMEKRRHECACLLQRVGLGMLGRRRARDERYRQMSIAAVTRIQAVARGWAARERFAVMYEAHVRHEAALLIQRVARGMAGRQRMYERRLAKEQELAVVVVQKRVRGYLARKYVHRLRRQNEEDFRISSAAALVIQRVFRGHRGRLEYRVKLKTKLLARRREDEAATLIEAIVRGYVARKKTQRLAKARKDKWYHDARLVKEYWSDETSSWYYYNEETGESHAEPPRTGYTKNDGRLVLVTGQVVDDPYTTMSEEEVKEQEAERMENLVECMECEQKVATRWCAVCDDPFCDDCWAKIHSHGKRRKHAFANIHENGSVSPRFSNEDGDDAGAFPAVMPNTTAATLLQLAEDGTYADDPAAGYDASMEGYGYENADGSFGDLGMESYGQEYAGGEGYGEADMSQEWYQYTDENGYPYWYNVNTGVSTYDDPNAGAAAAGDAAGAAAGGEAPAYDENGQALAAYDGADASYDASAEWGAGYAEGGDASYIASAQGSWEQGAEAVSYEASEGGGEWQMFYDDAGIPYFYNAVTGVSQYEDPNAGNYSTYGGDESYQNVEATS